MHKFSLFLFTFLLAVFNSEAQLRTNPFNQDEELGRVSWYRDYDTALQLSKAQSKPVLILFQEVPGCATCRNYGHNVLSHPLMTEAIENEFIPLAIFNNKRGKDLEILKKYKEPTWNNPVVRIVDSEGKDIVNRVASDYSAKGLYNAMVKALVKKNIAIPEYMDILGDELSLGQNEKIEEAHFKMYCFWTGEKELGSQIGVLSTKAGFMSGEVVKVKYDSEKITKEQLERFARSRKMKPVPYKRFAWSEKDEDYYIQHSQFKYLPLSEVQKTKINSALGSRQDAQRYLSPKQQQWLKRVGKSGSKVLFDKDFASGWQTLASE